VGGVNIIAPPPLVATTIDTSNVTCYGDSNGKIILAVAGGTSPYSYTWVQIPTDNDSIATGLRANVYVTYIADGHGCTDTITNVITQPVEPLLSVMPYDTTLTIGDTIQFNTDFGPASLGTPQYTWTESTQTLSCLNCANPMTGPTDSVNIYTLLVSYDNGLCSISISDTIRVNLTDTFAIPSAFTPNGDGKNDTYYIRVTDTSDVKSFHMEIFDRWGQTVFSTNDITQGWDGTYKGKQQPSAVYTLFFTLEYGKKNKVVKKTASITLLR
jgi:gliding motility-associated-like protein